MLSIATLRGKKKSGENGVLLQGTKNISPQDADVERLLSGGKSRDKPNHFKRTCWSRWQFKLQTNEKRTRKEGRKTATEGSLDHRRSRRRRKWRCNTNSATTRKNYSMDILRQRKGYLIRKTDKTFRLNYHFAASIVIALMLKRETGCQRKTCQLVRGLVIYQHTQNPTQKHTHSR